MPQMRELAMYPVAVLSSSAVCLTGAALNWSDVTTYTVLAVVGIIFATVLNLWIDAARWRRSGSSNVG